MLPDDVGLGYLCDMGQGYLEEVDEVLKQADADLVQVFEQLVKHRYKVRARQLLTKDVGKVMD